MALQFAFRKHTLMLLAVVAACLSASCPSIGAGAVAPGKRPPKTVEGWGLEGTIESVFHQGDFDARVVFRAGFELPMPGALPLAPLVSTHGHTLIGFTFCSRATWTVTLNPNSTESLVFPNSRVISRPYSQMACGTFIERDAGLPTSEYKLAAAAAGTQNIPIVVRQCDSYGWCYNSRSGIYAFILPSETAVWKPLPTLSDFTGERQWCIGAWGGRAIWRYRGARSTLLIEAVKAAIMSGSELRYLLELPKPDCVH